MLSRRSKILLCLASLAPATVTIMYWEVFSMKAQMRDPGALVLSVTPGVLPVALFLVGASCFVGAIVSIVADIRRFKQSS